MTSETPERIVTIFGGSKCCEPDPEYVQAQRVGEMLAHEGFTICTGGYLGVMEAASRGAHDVGGRVLGIVMNQFKHEPNRYLTDKVATPRWKKVLRPIWRMLAADCERMAAAPGSQRRRHRRTGFCEHR